MPEVTATDNEDGIIENVETSTDLINSFYNASNNSYVFTLEGTYYIEFTSMDNAGNIAVLKVNIIVSLEDSGTNTEPQPGTDLEGYYASLSGLSGTNLKNAMYRLLNDTGSYATTTYGAANTILTESDVWIGHNTKYLYLIYSDTLKGSSKNGYPDEGYANPVWDSAATWNKEHVWAKSLFGSGSYDPSSSTRGIAADLHNLRASDTTVNSTRSNLLFTNQVTYTGNFGVIGSSRWYPGDHHRGDVARIIFYMDIRWGDDTSISKIGDLQTLLTWHLADPVDDFEINRNNVIYKYQKNRNPFIDHPELASAIYQ